MGWRAPLPACGIEPIEQVIYNQDGVEIPLVRMAKVLSR